MTHYNIGEIVTGWELIEREGRLELWKNVKNANYSIELFENEKRDEHWLLHAIRGNEENAREKLNTVSSILA